MLLSKSPRGEIPDSSENGQVTVRTLFHAFGHFFENRPRHFLWNLFYMFVIHFFAGHLLPVIRKYVFSHKNTTLLTMCLGELKLNECLKSDPQQAKVQDTLLESTLLSSLLPETLLVKS